MKMFEMCCYNKNGYKLIGLIFFKTFVSQKISMHCINYDCVHDKSNIYLYQSFK